MSITYNENGTATIFTTRIGDFVADLQQLFEEGYRADLNSNEGFPFASVGRYRVTMIKPILEEVKVEQPKPTSTTKTNRKAKGDAE